MFQKTFVWGYFQVLSKDKTKYDLNQYLVAVSICFLFYVYLFGPLMYFHKAVVYQMITSVLQNLPPFFDTWG